MTLVTGGKGWDEGTGLSVAGRKYDRNIRRAEGPSGNLLLSKATDGVPLSRGGVALSTSHQVLTDPTFPGLHINYPDADLLDPRFNRSSTPWHDLYYKDNYPRLQRIKAHWDPRNFFRHSQSIEPPD